MDPASENYKTCELREIEKLGFDQGGLEADKWPLLMDPSGNACTFLRYRDANYLNIANFQDLMEHRIRLSVLGGIR